MPRYTLLIDGVSRTVDADASLFTDAMQVV
jgi:hypothetical protein